MQLTSVDWLIVLVYFLIALVVGLYYARRAGKGIDEFFVSGRQLPWWLVGTSMVATTFSTDTPNLVTDIVRNSGVSGNWVWWAFVVTGMCTVFFYAKLWRRSEALTDIGFYELRYSGKPAAFLRGFRALYLGVFFNVIIMATVTLAAIKISGVLLGLDKYTTVVVCAAITAIYSAMSGLWGVVVTDLLLFALAMIGSISAAYYALARPEVGGLAGLMTHPELADKLNLFPDFSDWDTALVVFIIPLAVQWWSTWYPGAEPGGGGYVAQRMLAAKDEKNALFSTLWFNVAHYGLRPWPWILVALCSMVVYPTLDSIRTAFPNLDPTIVGHDLAYPAMLVFLPHGLLGLVVASLAAAYMSTISTHLNWGASYIVDDFYRRFVVKDGSSQHYIRVARISTVVLVILASIVSLWLENALQGFQIMLQVGAGTGLIFLLRWFWWRINAWSEISAMTISFLVAVYLQFIHQNLGFAPMHASMNLVVGVAATTVVWLCITWLTPPAHQETLQTFYNKIRPFGRGWAKVVNTGERQQDESLPAAFLCWFLGCVTIYTVVLGTGYIIYGNLMPGLVLLAVCIGAASWVLKLLPQIGFSK
ncbi:Na+:solute symporter [Acidobacteria bacterium AH-259-A15]|nr:Na+:solute symporter [Acidobacteria bacterium AH-259-A15]